jgi:hypothetical protein
MGKSTVEFISKGLIPLGPKKITRMTTNPEKERYLIYLPLECYPISPVIIAV